MFYLLLKASKETASSHPVFSRLLTLKQLLSQLEAIQSPDTVDDDEVSCLTDRRCEVVVRVY